MKKDPLTQAEFVPLRINQRFASPNNRIKYHNRAATALRRKIAFVDKPLHQNLKILNELFATIKDTNEIKLHKQFLLGKGFNFAVFTNYDTLEGKQFPMVYNYFIVSEVADQFKIIRK